MNIKLAGAIIAVCAVAAGAYMLGSRQVLAPGEWFVPGQVACTMEAKICPDGSSVGRTGPNCEFAACPGEASSQSSYKWTFEEAELSPDRIPATRVFINGKFVGQYNGSCSEIAGSSWTLMPGETSGVICWYAGGGHEVGVFGNEVRVGELDEGSAESPSFRGNFKTVFTL